MKNVFKIITLALCFIIAGYSHAQSLRNLVNDGVDKYKNKKFTDSEVDFKKGLEKAPDNFQAKFNLGDAQYMQQRYDEAIKSYQQALKFVNDKDLKAKVYHNIGNSLLKSQKYKESVDAYINALKMNSKDEETKYNLSYALNMLKQQQENKQQQNKNNKQDNKQDKNKDKQDQNKNDKNQQNQNQNKDQQAQQDNTKQQDKQDQQGKQDKNKMSKEEAQRILNALKNNEQDLQKKLRKFEGKRVTVSKDW
jgi:Ca-activated chloride channel homolog